MIFQAVQSLSRTQCKGVARSTFVTRKSAAGFTLIEAIVYIALFSLIMGGAVVAAYQIFESAGRTQTHAMLEEEGNFLIGKIGWTLSGVQQVNSPVTPLPGAACSVSGALLVKKWDPSIDTVLIELSSSNDILLARKGGSPTILNNSNVTVTGLRFEHCFGGGTNPESVASSLTLSARTPNGAVLTQDFFTENYLRK